MRFVLEKNKFLASIAFLYWFIENAKYGFRLLFLQQHPEYQFYLTGGITVVMFASTILFLLKLYLDKKLQKNRFGLPLEVTFMALLMGFAGISLFWSNGGAFPIGIWGDIILSGLMFVLLCRYGDIKSIGIQSLKGFIYGLLFTTFALLVVHPLDTPSLNRLGLENVIEAVDMGRRLVYANIFLIFLIYTSNSIRERLPLACLFMVFTYTLLMTFSKVATAAFFIVSLVMLCMMELPRRNKILLYSLTITAAILVALFSYDRFIAYTQLQGGRALETFSGRAVLWTVSWLMIQENPLWGYGAGATLDVNRILALEPDFVVVHTQSINEWLNMWFQYGIGGLLLAIGIYYSLIKRAFVTRKAGNTGLAMLVVGVVLFTLLRSPFEANLVGFILPEPFIILFAFWMKGSLVNNNKEPSPNTLKKPGKSKQASQNLSASTRF